MSTYKLVCGADELDLNDQTNYLLQEGWYPPASDTKYGMAGSLGLSRAGGKVLYESAQDRSWRFPILAMGESAMETQRKLSTLQNFINRAEVYLEYNPAAGIPSRPVWGQGPLRYPVKGGQVALDKAYGGQPVDKSIQATIGLVVGPYAEGLLQYALAGSGGLWEDNLVNNRLPRGTAVLPATTNLFTNPIFQYYSTWYQGWTKGSDLTYWQDTLPDHVLFGEASCGLVRVGTTNKLLTQSLTAANTNTHSFSCYARRADGGVINSSVIQMYYGAALTTSYQALPDGWYRLTATAAGVASARTTGVSVEVSHINLFVTGFQMEESGTATPLAYGDMVGCRWAGAMHNSSSSRLVGALYQSPALLFQTGQLDQGTMRVAFRWYYPSTFGADQYLADCGTWEIYYKASDDKIYFTDGTNTISTAAQTFSAGSLVVLHFVFGPGSMKIYKNGVEAATGAAYVSKSIANMYFGSNSTPANHGCQTWLDLTLWNEMASATAIAADYADIYPQLSSGDGWGKRINGMPWVWTEDGGVLDSYCDSTHLDTMAAGGVLGDAPARTLLNLLASAADLSLLLAHNSHFEPLNVRAEFYDASGTADGAALGGATQTLGVGTAESALGLTYPIVTNNRSAYYGKETYILASMKDAGSNLMLQGYIIFSAASNTIKGDWKAVTADSTLRKFLAGPVIIPDGYDQKYPLDGTNKTGWGSAILWQMMLKRSSGAGANVNLDFFRALVGKLAYCDLAISTSQEIIIDGETFLGFASGGITLQEQSVVKGAIIEMDPDAYNYLTIYAGDIGAATAHAANTVTVKWLQVAPRWKLL